MNKVHPEQDSVVISVQPADAPDSDPDPEPPQLIIEETPLVSTICGIVCGPCTFINSWFTVSEGEKKIVLNTGHIVGEATEPGCNFFNCCFREIRSVSTKLMSMELTKSKLVDSTGNPILVSAILVYRVTEPLKALLQVVDMDNTLRTQALAILRQVVSKFPYVSDNGTPCLTHDTATVNQQLRASLQATSKAMGVTISSFCLNELAFSEEVAANMLQRQSAEALLSARAFITQGVASLTTMALQELEKRNIRLRPHQRTQLAGNLLALLSGVEKD